MYNDRSSSTHTRVCAPYNIRSQVCTRSEGVDGCRPHPGRTISPAVRILCIHMCAERACVDDVDDGATTAYTHSCTLICEQRASVVLRVVGGDGCFALLWCSSAGISVMAARAHPTTTLLVVHNKGVRNANGECAASVSGGGCASPCECVCVGEVRGLGLSTSASASCGFVACPESNNVCVATAWLGVAGGGGCDLECTCVCEGAHGGIARRGSGGESAENEFARMHVRRVFRMCACIFWGLINFWLVFDMLFYVCACVRRMCVQQFVPPNSI